MPIFQLSRGKEMNCRGDWQQKIPNSKLMVLPGNSYHVAASHAALCAQATLEFIAGARVH